VAADAGENSHIDGAAHQGIVFKIGSQTTSGTFHTISQKATGVIGANSRS
jgi:hypothetical protein